MTITAEVMDATNYGETPKTKTVKIGDYVGFKADIEQGGQIIEIKPGRFSAPTILVLENQSGFEGEYIGGDTRTEMFASECWAY